MSKKRTNAELEAELKSVRKYGVADNVTRIVRDLIQYGAVVAIFYYLYKIIHTLAGKDTFADIEIGVFSNLFLYIITVVLGVSFGVGGILYGRKQAKLRRDVIERYHQFIQNEQRMIDPKRSSSRLTQRGDTRPEDDK